MPYYNHDGEPIKLFEWAQLQEIEEYRRVGYTQFDEDTYVSTIWLGLATNITGPPQIFETMVFVPDDDELNESEWRTCTYAEAIATHERVCSLVRAAHATRN